MRSEVDSQFVVGIDLGTSNCAMAFAEVRGQPVVTDFPIPQLEQLGTIAPRALLPSAVYLPSAHEFPPESTRLPWDAATETVVGEFARWQGARVPGRLVSSAKSWLCHPTVDRTAAILPWGALADVKRISPVEASSLLLKHMKLAWDSTHPSAPLREQDVVITVPASFDEVARALTVNAARHAGLERFTLLEEPQAAFYDFTSRHSHRLADVLENVRLILVVDLGGGTSDFTLVQAGVTPEGPVLRRIAVGEHLILGGDNMDAALGRKAEERMVSAGRKLTAIQWLQLVQASRLAKECLLATTPPDEYRLSLAGEGSRLIGGTLSATLSRLEAEQIILDGFFPACAATERPERSTRVALQEIGLPYAADPAVTRHLAAFLSAHRVAAFAALGQPPAGESSLARPDAVLLNGGVFNSPRIAARLMQVVSQWWPESPSIPLLQHDSLDLAVARGAACYGLVRRGMGRRITGGAAHALYAGLGKSGPEATQALCVIPRGQEEGEMVHLEGRVFRLTLGRPVRFPLFSSTSDRIERAGDVVPVGEDMSALPPIHTVLNSRETQSGQVPVHLKATLTEIGTLELWCVTESQKEQWRLEFELRGAEAPQVLSSIESIPPRFAQARTLLEQVFGNRPGPSRAAAETGSPAKEVKALWASLERLLGPREEWPVPLLRELWSVLMAGAGRRRRSADHERVHCQLLGFSLRPGFGYALDEWRCEQSARLFAEGVQFNKEKPNWTEFWILWRRISGGLSESRQQEIWTLLKPHLAHRVPPAIPKHIPKPKGIQPEGLEEMVRLGAALEHLDPNEKMLLGDWIAARLGGAAASGGAWTWALGRLGARVPIYGSAHKVVPSEKADAWAQLLIRPDLVRSEGALFAVAQLARGTGDRARDLEETTRERVQQALQAASAAPSWLRLVSEVVGMDLSDKARALGDTLPVGLQLASK